MKWQVCIVDADTLIPMARVFRGATFTKGSAMRKANIVNAQLKMVRWESVKADVLTVKASRHLVLWRVNLRIRTGF